MKITGNPGISVNISQVKEIGSLLKNINTGDTISASVIRSEGNKALLNIYGRTLTAEFTNGVPGGKNIELVLTEKSNEKIQFALKENDVSEKIFRILSSFSIMHEDDIKKSSLQNLARFINTGRPDLADINLFLLGLKKDQSKEKVSALFNRLLQKGVSFQALIDISCLIYSKYNPLLFIAYQYMLGIAGKKPFYSDKDNLSAFEDEIENFCDSLKDDDADFYLMLDYIFDEYRKSEQYGGMIFPEEESFSEIEYILKDDTVFLKFDLTSAGVLGVYVKAEKEQVLINFLSGKEDLLSFMLENESVLKNMLVQNGIKKSIVGYFNSKKMVDKLELWSLDFYTKSGFNVKA